MKALDKNILIILILFTTLSACKKSNNSFYPSSIGFKIELSHAIDGSPLELDTIKYLNEAGNLYSVVNLRYFISNVYLHNGSNKLLLKNIQYVDVRDVTTLNIEPDYSIPNGTYDSITFVFGLDTLYNVSGFFVNPPEINMAWPNLIGGGYHYMQLEGKYDSAGVVTKNYNVHTGATHGNPYYFCISIPTSSFTANGKNITAKLEMNINNWFTNPNTYDFNVYGDAIMGDATAQQVIKQNGHNVFSLKSIN